MQKDKSDDYLSIFRCRDMSPQNASRLSQLFLKANVDISFISHFSSSSGSSAFFGSSLATSLISRPKSMAFLGVITGSPVSFSIVSLATFATFPPRFAAFCYRYSIQKPINKHSENYIYSLNF